MSEGKEYECKNIQESEWKTEDMIVRWVKDIISIVDSHNEAIIELLVLTKKLEKRLDALESKRDGGGC